MTTHIQVYSFIIHRSLKLDKNRDILQKDFLSSGKLYRQYKKKLNLSKISIVKKSRKSLQLVFVMSI